MIGCFEFEIKDKEQIQDVGFRLKVAQRIPDDLDARIDNIGEVVKVRLKGDEKRVQDFYNKLKDELSRNPITFMPLNSIEDTQINTDRFYHMLQCEQLDKFVSVGLDMRKAIVELPERLAKVMGKK